MLPWVHGERRAFRDRGELASAEGYLACEPCLKGPAAARQQWNCGFEERIPGHRGSYPLPEGAPRSSCDTCPGYLVNLPQVAEVARAYAWWEKGQLRDFCDGQTPPALLREYVTLLYAEVNESLAARLDRQREERARG